MENSRYNRQIMLPEVGIKGQEKLQNAKVLIVGAGGLGSVVLPYLAGAGIGEIGIMDHDVIELTNLQRQVIYKEESVGKSKAVEAKDIAQSLNSSVKVNAISEKLSPKNALKLFEYYDIIIDATDHLPTKYLINDACCVTQKPFVYGSVYRFEGQVSVFNYQNGPTYRCLFQENLSEVSNCNEAGILGVSVGIIGMLQANEVLKIVLEIGEVTSGKLLIYNMLTNDQHSFEFSKKDAVSMDTDSFQKKYSSEKNNDVTANYISSEIGNPKIIFLDVRNSNEQPTFDFNNYIQIPLTNLEQSLHLLDKNKEIVVFCQSGIRSKKAVELLQKHAFNAKNSIDGAPKIKETINTQTISV
jgi:sulfur-carrier protein adenylyltransferase/sulfurtransferase